MSLGHERSDLLTSAVLTSLSLDLIGLYCPTVSSLSDDIKSIQSSVVLTVDVFKVGKFLFNVSVGQNDQTLLT